jgi:monoterpene epsilon-lactone hydrolase
LFGALTGLPPTIVFIGTRDVLLSDARRLRDRTETVGGGIDYPEYPGMIHNWPRRRIPEGRRALHRITEQLATQAGNAGEPGQPLDSRWPAYRRAPR